MTDGGDRGAPLPWKKRGLIFSPPGAPEWLRSHAETILLICFAPLYAGLFAMVVMGFLAWVVLLPVWLVRGFWRKLRS